MFLVNHNCEIEAPIMPVHGGNAGICHELASVASER